MNYFDLLEAAKSIDLSVESTLDWSYGEGCECGCKWVVVAGIQPIAHCKTLKQVERTLNRERRGSQVELAKPHVAELKGYYEQLRLTV